MLRKDVVKSKDELRTMQRLNSNEAAKDPISSPRRHRVTNSPLGILFVSVVVILLLILQILLSRPTRVPAIPFSVPKRVDPIVLEYSKQNLVGALQQSIMAHHNVLCADLAELQKKPRETLPSPPDFPVRMSFRLNCEQLFTHNIYGTGNVLLMFYNIRLIARLVGNVEVTMECTDAVATRSQLVVPWLMGSFAATPSPGSSPNLKDACDSLQPKTVHLIVDDIKYELRRMALSLVGVPYKNHPADKFVQEDSREKSLQVPMPTSPLLPGVELDDVAIHFRCGDIIEVRAHHKYRYARWSSLAKLISPDARSIGIVTQPRNGQVRGVDSSNRDRCPQLLEPMLAYFQKKFPRAKVSLRNSPEETIALAFTRFIMANQSLAGGFSTFYSMPFYATFGTAYEIEEGDSMISSESMMGLWKKEDGLQQILSLFTSGVS